ncbi:hypothetical protein BofuT4_uP018940.1 [Botrytis cinerea T4]|uniref:Uncharacterized protein n=1 Tax=Botryotinia fuckeliana (strain T4) TaxID=999810 RepID=G2YIQ1_BOTF4|nr:hypothetical protein BofuT4_uP018940.1 [Botrytis cinerea T4]
MYQLAAVFIPQVGGIFDLQVRARTVVSPHFSVFYNAN